MDAGTRLGPYEIVSPLGAGGMGEVYRAHDARLGREVAVKILPAAFAHDPERLRRFEQEARAASVLNHPNILAIYDVGAEAALRYVVSELLEGQTLRDRLADEPIPLAKAIDYALQAARGLTAAHERGIVHRDLKPENLFVTHDDRVKILDFGLAKLSRTDPGSQPGFELPTMAEQTEAGAVLGTVGYMSPEQVRATRADHRSDIFAFGAILYEMIAGRRAFERESAVETMNAILKEEPPPVRETGRQIPPALDRVVQRCLAKRPEQRFQSASDLAFALEALSGVTASTPLPSAIQERPAPAPGRLWIAWVFVAVAAFAAGAATAYVGRPRPRLEAETYQFAVAPPDRATFPTTNQVAAISPDGRRIAFVANTHDGKTLLWVRPLDTQEPQALADTDGAKLPFWSPDSRSIGFFAQGKLKRIDASGGASQTISDAPNGDGGSWNMDGVIVFAPKGRNPLLRVSAAGGGASPVSVLETMQGSESHCCPSFLPDGRHFVFSVDSERSGRSGVYVRSLDSTQATRLLEADVAVFAPPGYLLWLDGGALKAQRFDLGRLALVGGPIALVQKVGQGFSVSQNGVLAYGTGRRVNQLVWFDRHGGQLAAASGFGNFRSPELAPDDKRVAFESYDAEKDAVDLWLIDLSRRITSRLTRASASEFSPIWAPDAVRIVFSSVRNGQSGLYQTNATGTGEESLLLQSPVPHSVAVGKKPSDWSRDGRFILFNSWERDTKDNVLMLPLSVDGKPGAAQPFVQTAFVERDARFSPDGRWVAYVSDESGKFEVYVQPVVKSGAKWQISTDGGFQPRWRRDGKELFYVAPDKRLMTVQTRSGATFDAGIPQSLFEMRVGDVTMWPLYDVTADGQQFLISAASQEGDSLRIAVVVNWVKALATR
jgi:Tol biopolymer transport system component